MRNLIHEGKDKNQSPTNQKGMEISQRSSRHSLLIGTVVVAETLRGQGSSAWQHLPERYFSTTTANILHVKKKENVKMLETPLLMPQCLFPLPVTPWL